jgi:hypothetical protein
MQCLDLSGDSKYVAQQIVEQCVPATKEPNIGADYYRGLSTQACRVLLESMKASGHSLTLKSLADHLASYDLMASLLKTSPPGEARDSLRLFLDQFEGADGGKKYSDLLGPIGARISSTGIPYADAG